MPSVGDTINLLGQNFTVVGIQGNVRSGPSLAAFMSLEDAQTITNTTGQALKLIAFADRPENVDTVESKIKTEYPQLQVQTNKALINNILDSQGVWENQTRAAQAKMSNIENTATMEIGIVVGSPDRDNTACYAIFGA